MEYGNGIVPKRTISIVNNCFSLCKSLTIAHLPSTLISIGDHTFSSRDNKEIIPLKQVEVRCNCKIGIFTFDDGYLVILK